jgi:cytochrome c553
MSLKPKGNEGKMKIPISGNFFSSKKIRMALAAGLVVSLFPSVRVGAQSTELWKLPDIPWAFPVRDKVQPELDERKGPMHLPGSSKAYTQDEVDNFVNVPDWFPDEHAPMPKVVAHGAPGGVLGCASCHLASGLGHPESANLAGVPAVYILRQLADFKAGNRMGEAMNDMAKNLTDDDAKLAADWFAALKPKVWQSVVETDRVPKTFINEHLMRMPLPGAGDELLGQRIIELPQDIARAESRDPHSGFIAYVPKGSLAKGKEFVNTGGGGKTIQCVICHGPSLNGLGEVPPIAGHDPMYLFRQLYYFKDGSRHGSMGALMKGVVAKMNQDDMIAIAAYVASLPPGAEESSFAAPGGQASVKLELDPKGPKSVR